MKSVDHGIQLTRVERSVRLLKNRNLVSHGFTTESTDRTPYVGGNFR
jgi:hypothetical protein